MQAGTRNDGLTICPEPAASGGRGRRAAVVVGLMLLVGLGQPAGLATEPDGGAQATSRLEPDDPAAALDERRARTQAEFDRLAQEIGLSQERLEALQADVAALSQDQAALRAAMIEAAARQKALKRTAAEQEARLAGLRERQDAIRGMLRSRRKVLAEVLAALERMGRDPPPALLIEPGDALGSVRSAILLGAVVPEIRGETEALAADLQSLAAVREAIDRERAQIAKTLMTVAEEEKRLELLIAEKQRRLAANRTAIAEERADMQALAENATSLEELIGTLEREIASVRAAADAARQAETERRQRTAEQLERAREFARNGSPDKNRIAPAHAFSALTGLLDLPVAGTPVRWYGDEDGSGHRLQGMMVSASPGSVVTAPADGWVVYGGPFRSYGQLLILNVGDGYHVVLAGMDRITAAQGQFVVAGEPVAEMGQTRLAGAVALALVSDQPTLYIEFRRNGKPVDPRPWWASRLSGRVSNGT